MTARLKSSWVSPLSVPDGEIVCCQQDLPRLDGEMHGAECVFVPGSGHGRKSGNRAGVLRDVPQPLDRPTANQGIEFVRHFDVTVNRVPDHPSAPQWIRHPGDRPGQPSHPGAGRVE